jgi:regulator of nucleoside diphosphate kinase
MKIHITKFDLDRLNQLLEKRKPHDEYDRALSAELENAEVLPAKSIPDDVITMNSQVKFKDIDGKEKIYWLVFPEDADVTENKISVLSPVGCSLIGYSVGSDVVIPTPHGNKKLTVEEILYQPERAGDFDR